MSCREQSAADLNVVASEHARDWLGVPPFVTASGGALALGVFSSTIRSYENGTVLKRQFWLRGLFVEILVAAPLPPGRGLWPLGRVEERVAFLTRRVGSGLTTSSCFYLVIPCSDCELVLNICRQTNF